MTDVDGRVVLITGAASGIGRLLAGELARRGARLVLWDLGTERLAGVRSEIAELTGREPAGYGCDVSDRHAVAETAARVRAEVGEVDVLVNNAGVVSGRCLVDLPDEKIEQTFAVNTLALYWTTKAFLPSMIDRRRGHIVTIASAAALVGVAKQTDYSASKHAAFGFDESLRVELARTAPSLVTTVVCPFYINTGMFAGVKTRFPLLLPILEQDDVARKIARAIERDRRLLVMPPLVRILPAMRVLPPRAFDAMMNLFGVNRTMDDFVGRNEPAGTRPG
jgi:all-trans-retinol dehydrogenase (NAD+)